MPNKSDCVSAVCISLVSTLDFTVKSFSHVDSMAKVAFCNDCCILARRKSALCLKAKRPLLSTLMGFPIFRRYFSYSFNATGSYLLPCSNEAAEISFCAKRSVTNFLCFLCFLEIFPKLDAVNLYFRSCIHSTHPACSHVFSASLFALGTFTLRLSSSSHSFSVKLTGGTNELLFSSKGKDG